MNIVSIRPQLVIASTLLIGLATVAAACGPAQPPEVPGGKVAVADTPVPADGQCDFVNYHHDEAKNAKGPGKCGSDCDCDGMRSCTSGVCQGKARPETLNAQTCNSKDYHYRESWTPGGKCSGDCECDGLRTCVSGQCTGTAR